MDVTLADVRDAAGALDGVTLTTPATVSDTLSELCGCTVVVKFENLQFIASFKERGARNRLRLMAPDERAAGVVAVSAGNHAQAVARHARLLDIPATIVMPEHTPYTKVARTQALGAEVVLHGDSVAAAMAHGIELVALQGRTFVHPFDDPAVIAGQGTVGLELLAQHPDLDAWVVPVGGGGLLAGMAVVARELAPSVELVGVQTEECPSMARALAGDRSPTHCGSTLAEGIAVEHAGALTLPILADAGAEVVTVRESAIERAINLLLDIEKSVAEGAGAAGLAAVLEHRDRFRGKRVGIVLTGGNIDPRTLASVVLRGLVQDGRLNRWRIGLPDRPGALAGLTAVVAEAGANIVEVQHQRLFSAGPIRHTDIELAVETMDRAHSEAVLAALRAKDFEVEEVPLDGG